MIFTWNLYTRAYVFITLGYLWYRFILLFLSEFRKRPVFSDDVSAKISVIVPFYNEDPEILENTIKTLLAAKGNKELIMVDDGSPNRECHDMISRKYASQVRLVRYEKNQGKRVAQSVGFENSSGDFTVFIDSDTIIEENSLLKLVAPLAADSRVGATTGNVKVYNHSQNFLTKMVSARYWNAFNIERKSLSSFGVVTCCSGALSAYRSSLLKVLMAPYLSQKFLGEECTYGDDRHLTNLVLMRNHKVLYVEEAVCYTVVPHTYRKFFKQQLRWKKSFLRESLVSLTFAFRHSFLLPVEVLFNGLIPFFSLGLRISLMIALVMNPLLIPFFLVSVTSLALIRNFFLIFEDRKMAFYSLPYALLHEIGLYWLYFVALFTLRENKWGTR